MTIKTESNTQYENHEPIRLHLDEGIITLKDNSDEDANIALAVKDAFVTIECRDSDDTPSVNIDGIDYREEDRIKLWINLNIYPPEGMTAEETAEYEKRNKYVKMFKYNDKDDTVYTCDIEFSNEMAGRMNDDHICVFDSRYHGKYLTPLFGVDDIAHLLCQCIGSRVITHMERIHVLREFYDIAMDCMAEGMDFEMEDGDIQTRI